MRNQHPQYVDMLSDWIQMRDCYKGERRIKSRNALYLPATSGHIQDGYGQPETVGQKAYEAYKKRARFPNFVEEAVNTAIGMMHSQSAEIVIPDEMQGIISSRGEDLQNLLRRINAEQLLVGRIGLMADLPSAKSTGSVLPYLTTYVTERIVNWDDGDSSTIPQTLNLVILDESEFVRNQQFAWSTSERTRYLVLGDLGSNETGGAVYRQGLFDGTEFNEAQMITPMIQGRTLSRIPFVMINGSDITAEVDNPPLLNLSNMCLAIYRGEADYRQNLFMQGQDTLITKGWGGDEDESVRVGAGGRIDLPEGGDAKYIGVQSSGLEEQRLALERLELQAGSMGAQTLDTVSRERESGDSLRIRVAARTANLNQIADTGAAGLQEMLKICADWMGLDSNEISVTPNKEFGEMPLTGQTMVEMATARNAGWPISARTLHDLSVKRKITSKTFEEEIAEIEKEKDTVVAPAQTADRAGPAQQE